LVTARGARLHGACRRRRVRRGADPPSDGAPPASGFCRRRLGRAGVSSCHLLRRGWPGRPPAAREEPELFAEEIRAAFRSQRW